MSEPVWMDVSFGAMPTPEVLAGVARKGKHVVLRFAGELLDSACLNEAVKMLAPTLPEHSVFISGPIQVTILPVIARSEVLRLADDLVRAAIDFRCAARDLCVSLARKLDVQPEELVDYRRSSGLLDSEWSYRFHGLQCCFKNEQTGQVLDVELSYRREFGVLDPYFFHRFLATTNRYQLLASQLIDGYHDTDRALDLLVEAGRLTRITLTYGGSTQQGVVANSADAV
jgi:hypothetical protein